MYQSPVTNALWEARSSIFERLLDPPKDAPPQSELLTKTPSQSRTTIFYGFSSDYILREQYRDPWNEVRIGKLLEDLDALAGTISVKVSRWNPVFDFVLLLLDSLYICAAY
jgi:acyl-coenzyme A thioesterase 9